MKPACESTTSQQTAGYETRVRIKVSIPAGRRSDSIAGAFFNFDSTLFAASVLLCDKAAQLLGAGFAESCRVEGMMLN